VGALGAEPETNGQHDWSHMDADLRHEPEFEPEAFEPEDLELEDLELEDLELEDLELETFEPEDLDPETFDPETLDPEAARTRGPVHARARTDGQGGRSRVFVATVVLAGMFLAVAGAAAIVHSLHGTTAATTPPPAGTAPLASASPAAARIQSATDEVDSATTSAQADLASLQNFPTPSNVGAVVNPYVASLRLYLTYMSGASVPAPAQAAAVAAETEVRHDVTFFSTIDGLPPIRLGAFLDEFAVDQARLQATLTTLEQDLGTSAR
jgi:hypothetical protein